jgi:hypothetical protein
MSKALFGHDIPYVLLMHVGAFDARMLPRLLNLYREKGFSFISLDQAEKDPFYKAAVNPSLPRQAFSLEGAMQERGLALPPTSKLSMDVNNACR